MELYKLKNKTKQQRKERGIYIFGTLNVRKMLTLGKMEEIARKVKKYKVGILALLEMRWREERRLVEKSTCYLIQEERTKREMELPLLFGEGQGTQRCNLKQQMQDCHT